MEYIHKESLIGGLFSEEFVGEEPILEFVDSLPTIEIVHCKDCKHADEYHHCDKVTWWNSEDDFCSKGERREDGEIH